MPRYTNTKDKQEIINRGAKREKYNITSKKTTLYNTIPLSDKDIYVTTQTGDRLDMLASRFYDNPTLWWYIAKANNLNFMTLPAGISLRIPHSVSNAKGR